MRMLRSPSFGRMLLRFRSTMFADLIVVKLVDFQKSETPALVSQVLASSFI